MKYVITDSRLKEPGLDPEYMVPSSTDANSVDLRACIEEEITIFPDQQIIIPAGIKIALPQLTMGMIIPRSGLGVKGLVIGNLVGNIDPDYRGEVKVCLWNRSELQHKINPLDRIAQLVVVSVFDPNSWKLVTCLDHTARGEGGFGSTGSK